LHGPEKTGRDARPTIRTGLCSVTLRALAAGEVIRVAAAAGLDGIEWGADIHVPPGDLATAASVRAATTAAGLRVASYGSYFRAGRDSAGAFGAVLDSARALGAPRIRIWAGATASADATPSERAAVAAGARDAVDRAAAAGLDVAFEFHRGTLADEADSALALLDAVDRPAAAMYWQPPEDLPDAPALAGLERLLGRLTAVHVFSWWPGNQRRRLAERAGLWRAAFERLAKRPAQVDALLEFVPDDDPDLVAAEARTLSHLLEQAGA
jgi:sugar phosphate isomerase/epimerase